MELHVEENISNFPSSGMDLIKRSIQCIRDGNNTLAEKHVRLLRQVCHDQLNVGKYENVELHWRRGYYYCSYLLCIILMHSEYNAKDVLKIADEGILMGSPIGNDLLSAIVKQALKSYTPSCEPLPSHSIFNVDNKDLPRLRNPIRRLTEPPSLMEWISIRKAMKPVVIENLIGDWPAASKWTLPYIWKMMKGRTVPIEEGSKYTDADWGQQLICFDDFFAAIDKPTVKRYLAQHPLLEQIPELQDDIDIPGKLTPLQM